MRWVAFFVLLCFVSVAPALRALGEPIRITFATDWKAQAEHGGFYQAKALGLYAARGLDVTIRMGGPGQDNPRLIAAGAIDLAMASNNFQPLNLIAVGARVKAVMASFQKDPQVLMTHPEDRLADLRDLRGRPVIMSDSAINTWWPWLKSKYGLSDRQIRKYTYSLAPWLVSPGAVQEGYLSSEPFSAGAQGVLPNIYLLADHGYHGYSAMIMVSERFLERQEPAVRGFVEATIEGWYSYLNDDPAPADLLIKGDNPEMTDALLAYSRNAMRDYGIVESGDAKALGIGAMTDARWKAFFEDMAGLGLFDPKLDYRRAYTTRFVNQRHGARR